MLFSLIHSIIAMLLLLTNTCAVGTDHQEACEGSYTPCSPPGATNSVVPPVGGALSGLYFDLVGSANPQPVRRDLAAYEAPDQTRDASSNLCCTQGTECRLLQSYSLAFCWDRFTTNYFLPDGSYGNVFSGYYNSSSGVTANLVSGNIALPDGQTRNIYAEIPQGKPVTSLLPVPTPWTSTGDGTAIPDSELGFIPTYSLMSTEDAISLTNTLSFLSTTPASGPARTRSTMNGSDNPTNSTGFPIYPTEIPAYPTDSPTYPTAGMGEPYGYGPAPTPNTTSVEPSTGLAVHLVAGSRSVLYSLQLASLALVLHSSFCA